MISVSPVTNRLTTASYDDAGNLTDWNGTIYSYDPLNRLTQQQAGSLSWTHLYTAGGERLWTIHEPGGLDPLQETVSLRDLSGRVLRQYEVSSGLGNDEWSWKRDMIYGDGRLVSSVHPGGEVRHYHLDHLGTPRRVTDGNGDLLYQHDYLPYGEEVTDSGQNQFPLKYTGHERDAGYAGTMDDLDYMHARYYSPFLGRFSRVDPMRGSPASPQSLNRYAYVLGNPMNLTDLRGLCPRGADFCDEIDVVGDMPPDFDTPWTPWDYDYYVDMSVLLGWHSGIGAVDPDQFLYLRSIRRLEFVAAREQRREERAKKSDKEGQEEEEQGQDQNEGRNRDDDRDRTNDLADSKCSDPIECFGSQPGVSEFSLLYSNEMVKWTGCQAQELFVEGLSFYGAFQALAAASTPGGVAVAAVSLSVATYAIVGGGWSYADWCYSQ